MVNQKNGNGNAANGEQTDASDGVIFEEPVDIDEDEFFAWVNPSYLDPVNQAEIQESFEANSEISLQDFVSEDKYEEMCTALKNPDLHWQRLGPANKQNYEKLSGEEIPLDHSRMSGIFKVGCNVPSPVQHYGAESAPSVRKRRKVRQGRR